MHLRDKEIQRVVQYAKGLGIEVRILPYDRSGDGGGWMHNPPSLYVYTWPGQSKTTLILLMIHELGHHLDWIHRGKRISKRLLEALSRDNTRTVKDPVLPKSLRKLIWQSEYDGTAYMPIIAKELDLKIPPWKVEAEMQFDRYIADYYLKHGNYPTDVIHSEVRKQIRREVKGKANV